MPLAPSAGINTKRKEVVSVPEEWARVCFGGVLEKVKE
jgi:hypothetical protein